MHDAGAFADDEAVAVLVERPARALRLVVARRQRAHRGEPADAHRRDRRLRSAGDHHVGVAARMISYASPMACADAVHAVQVARVRAPAPNRIDTWPAARLMMADGNEERRDACAGRLRAAPCARARSS